MNDPQETSREFGDAWRVLEPALRRSLSSAPAHLVEDVLQETGIKLMRAWDSIDHERPPLPFAITIARNTLRDELRKSTRHAHVELLEEHRVGDDLDARVSARVELARVEAELPRLTPGQRAALLMEVGGGQRAADSASVKMLRSRARQRLRELLAQAGGFVSTAVARLRTSGGQRAAAAASDLGILVQALLLVVVAANVGTPEGSTEERRPPATVVHVPGNEAGARASRAASTFAAAPGTPAGKATAPAVADVRPDAPREAPSAGSPAGPLPPLPVPHSKGGARDSGSFGIEGYDFAGSGETTLAGHPVGYRYEGRWESPECVQRLGNGTAPGQCAAPETPDGYVEIEVDGQRHRVGSDGGPGRRR